MSCAELRGYVSELGEKLDLAKTKLAVEEKRIYRYVQSQIGKLFNKEYGIDINFVDYNIDVNYFYGYEILFHVQFGDTDFSIRFSRGFNHLYLCKWKMGTPAKDLDYNDDNDYEYISSFPVIDALYQNFNEDKISELLKKFDKIYKLCYTTNYLNNLPKTYTFLLCNKKSNTFCRDITKIIATKILFFKN